MADTSRPDLHEKAWTRAKSEAASVYRSPIFGVGATLVQLVALSLTILVADDNAPTDERIVVPILVGALVLALTFLSVLVVKVALTPVAQRDELRRAWPTGSVERPPDVRLTLLNFARVAADIIEKIEKYGYIATREAQLDDWTNQVVEFLAPNVSAEDAAEFIELEEAGGYLDRAKKRVALLRSIAEKHK